MLSHNKGIYLSSNFPKLKDPKRKIITSQMTVMIPVNNKLICENAYGELIVSDIKKDIEVNTKYCQTSLTHISGGIKALVASGETQVMNSYGPINITSSHGPVTVLDSEGEFEIQNSHSSIEFLNSTGKAKVQILPIPEGVYPLLWD